MLAHRELAPTLALDPKPRAPRFFAMQFKQESRNVVTYAAFRRKLECMIERDVVPHLARGRPNVVVFDEDNGLMTIATGSRGAGARALLANPGGVPGCQGQPFPCATLGALKVLDQGYARAESYYRQRFGRLPPLSASFIAATDTFVSGFMQTFSDLARRYGIYIIASNTQAPFRASTRPADIAALADPSLPRPRSVYVATAPLAYNHAFMWAPRDVRRGGPTPLRNVVADNRKVPLTSFEVALGFAPGPSTGSAAIANLRPYHLPGTAARIGIATSLPAFTYGNPARGHECDDVSVSYMRCLSALGSNVMIQADANDGPWIGPDGNSAEMWQPLSWMGSSWRSVSDPALRFDYAVNPMMVGNLADTPFDGQSAILQRGRAAAGCHYIGNRAFVPGEDLPDLASDAGAKPEFLALAPWVASDQSRAALRAIGAKLAPGSRDRLQNDYVETAVAADLPFPVDRHHRGCVTR